MENSQVTLKNIITLFKHNLSHLYPDQEIMQFVTFLAEEYLGWSKAMVHGNFNTYIEPGTSEIFNKALIELKRGVPIQYIIGKAWFDELIFKVTPDVLIPRPETEELLQLVIRENSGKTYQEFSILDIGTGSGCLAVSLKRAFPHARVSAMDKSAGALSIARENAHLHNTDITFLLLDILDRSRWPDSGEYDVIVSNPPYVLRSEQALMHRNVVDHEPDEALYVPDEDPLLFYRTITEFAWKKISRPGTLYFEINEKFGEEVKRLVQSAGFEKAGVVRDFQQKDRFVKAEARNIMLDSSYWYADKQ
jgi:release factor glutamine methyltransferase